MHVVSDASPLILLAKIGRLELFSEVIEVSEKLGLHKGEMYALSLALHVDIKEFLADDKLARIATRILGLKGIGCLGVVMMAYETGIITRNDATNAIWKLVEVGLWISPEVLGELLTALEV